MPALKADFRHPEVQTGEGSTPGIAVRPAIRINDELTIPPEVRDLESFCRWTGSDDFPERGHVSYLGGLLWVDLSMEEIFGHNLLKGEFTRALTGLAKEQNRGRFFPDGVWVTNEEADLSTEPDGMFVSYETLRSGKIRTIKSPKGILFQLRGTPEMTLEIISPTSELKDTKELFQLYWRAGVEEYWLVDVRAGALRIDIYKHGPRGYLTTRRQAGGWLKSGVFGKSFQLTEKKDPLGYPLYNLEIRG